MEKLDAATDYCIMVLKSYMDKFYKYEKEKWEAPLLEYQELAENDNNFVSEYSISYTDMNEADANSEAIEKFINDIRILLENESGITAYEKSILSNSLIAFDFRSHLYAPLICFKGNGLKIQVSPVSLNEDEKLFVDKLKEYTDSRPASLENKAIFLLRNKSKVGMGFFEAGNFYPDYVLWIDTPDTQYVSFIDPKGLMKLMPDDPKIEFYKTIKVLEERLQPTARDKRIVLNSFIMSGTKSSDLRSFWNMEKKAREAKHVLCLDNDDCIEVMFDLISG